MKSKRRKPASRAKVAVKSQKDLEKELEQELDGAPEEREEVPAVRGRIVQRPDGFYWETKAGELRGPFESRAEAEADRLAGGSAPDEGSDPDSLLEAESELGISEWIDPDTGGPAEDSVPRIEEH